MTHATVDEHRAVIARLLGAGRTSTIPLDRHALGRRLAADLLAVDDVPRFDNSAMDGYAAHPGPTDPLRHVVVEDVPAGAAPARALAPGEAARVMTGARLPEGTVGVVPVEQTDASPTGPVPTDVVFAVEVTPGQHVRHRAEDVAAGSVVATRGSAITPALIALGRSAGCAVVDVCLPTRVAVIATGTELVPVGTAPGAGGIHESNSDMLAALAVEAGCEVVRVETCGDEPSALTALLDELSAATDVTDATVAVDVILTTGGVSAGAYEVVRQVCEPLVPPEGAFAFVHLAMQPGGPQGAGLYRGTPVICLPGTPVGAFVGFVVLVRPALDERHGAQPRQASSAAYAGRSRRTRAGKVQFVTAHLAPDGTVTAPDARHLTALAAANALIEVPVGIDQLVAGDVVLVHVI